MLIDKEETLLEDVPAKVGTAEEEATSSADAEAATEGAPASNDGALADAPAEDEAAPSVPEKYEFG